ncbi:MAG: hypothetical protein WA197_07215 [Candidatus Acidiferrales bacterium]
MKISKPLLKCALVVCCLYTATPALAQSSEGNTGKIHEYKDDVALSTGQIRRGDICVNFIPVLQSGSFFDGLERIDSSQGSEFRKNSRVVTNFPDFMTVEMKVRIEDCDTDVYTPAPTPAFVKGIHFRVQWKRGLAMRPVAAVSIEQKPVLMDEGDNRMLFLMYIHDRDVPLTDHLIISVIGPDGKLMSRMSARL